MHSLVPKDRKSERKKTDFGVSMEAENEGKRTHALVHIQVRKIKEEDENIRHWLLSQMLEMRPMLRELKKQVTQSPLGQSSDTTQAISVGN
ncbi:hypothetical protein M5K25_025457 [Dendrobium thyrsiflorum]|uniref:Uncharacterized protein n=1 Tax=Dendrobium thyrsiflorum TaxID=117978 RepID=A0ABD0U4E5_DENTH